MRDKKPEKSVRQALLVLGMHRSGTSALGGVLARLGVQSPKGLMAPDPNNPRGYWESWVLTAFHDRVLASAGTRWSDWDRFNEGWADSPVGTGMLAELAGLIEQEYGDAPLFLVKDPRMCRLLPVWLQVLGNLRITPKVVIPLRDPREVSESLATRDQMTRMRAHLIWLRHVLDAEHGSRGLARAVIRYPDLLADWRSQTRRIASRLDLKWPRWSSAVEAEIETYLTSELRHHAMHGEALSDSSEIGRWVGIAYRALDVLAEEGENAEAWRALDEVRREFDRTSEAYAPVLYEVRGDLERKIEKSNSELAAATQALKEADARHGLLKQENQANYELAMGHKATLDDLREQYQNRENAHASLEARHELMQAEVAAQLQAHKDEIENISDNNKSRLAEMADKLQSRETAYSQLESMYQSLSIELDKQSDASDLVQDEIKTIHRAEMADVATRLQAGIKELKTARRVAEESLQERFAEVAMLSRRVLDLEDRIQAREVSIRDASEQLQRHAVGLEACQTENLSLRDTVTTDESKIRAMGRELEIQASLVAECQSELDVVRSNPCLRIARAARRMTGKPSPSPVESPKSDAQLLRNSNLFDSAWYLKRYRDVRSRGMDPVKHYLRYGAREGRDPGPAFSTAGYQARYPDVASAGLNPLIHYLRYGRKEGRSFLALERVLTNGSSKRASKD